MTKYGFEVEQSVIDTTISRLTNQLWKLIPMKEQEEDWEKQLDIVILEIVGLNEIFSSNPTFLQLLAKLEGLKNTQIEFSAYRKIVFDSINLLQGLKKRK